jgi:hypothetical protein
LASLLRRWGFSFVRKRRKKRAAEATDETQMKHG